MDSTIWTNIFHLGLPVLESSGRISFIPKKPVAESYLNDEVIKRLDQISRELADLRASRR